MVEAEVSSGHRDCGSQQSSCGRRGVDISAVPALPPSIPAISISITAVPPPAVHQVVPPFTLSAAARIPIAWRPASGSRLDPARGQSVRDAKHQVHHGAQDRRGEIEKRVQAPLPPQQLTPN